MLCVIWVALLGLLLEGYEVLRLNRAAKASYKYFEDNIGSIPWMQLADRPEFGSNRNAPPPGGSGEPNLPQKAPDAIAATAFGPCSVPDPIPRTAEEARKKRDDYARQGEEQRNVIETVEGRVEITLDPEGRCLGVSGEPLLGQAVLSWMPTKVGGDVPTELAEAVRQASKVDKPVTCESDYKWSHYEIQIAPQRNAANVIEQILITARECGDSHAFGAAAANRDPSMNPMWEVPFFSFKKKLFERGRYTTNSFGFADTEVAVPRPPGMFRIACVGGSATMEADLDWPRYTNMLRKMLQNKYGADAVEVVNCGIVSFDSYRERRRVQDYLALDPNLIVYYNGVNDVSVSHMPVWNNQVADWQRLLRRSRFLNRWFNHAFLPSEEYVAQFMKATTIRNLRALAYAARERGVAVALCSFACPDPARLDSAARDYLDINFRFTWNGQYPDYGAYVKFLALHNRLVKQACEEDSLLYIPLAENFHEGMDHFKDVCHMNVAGMRLKAEIIAACISPCIEQARAVPVPSSAAPPAVSADASSSAGSASPA
jgi:hypothetical protein